MYNAEQVSNMYFRVRDEQEAVLLGEYEERDKQQAKGAQDHADPFDRRVNDNPSTYMVQVTS